MKAEYPTNAALDAISRLGALVITSSAVGHVLGPDEMHGEGWSIHWSYPGLFCAGAPMDVTIAFYDRKWRARREGYAQAVAPLALVPAVTNVRFIEPARTPKCDLHRAPRIRLVLHCCECQMLGRWLDMYCADKTRGKRL